MIRASALRRLSPALAAPALAAALAFAPGQAAAEEGLSDAAREALRTEIRAYLLEHPEVVMEAIQELEKRRRVAQAEEEAQVLAALRGELRDDGYSFVAGNPDGDVTVVEFLDYNCGYCKKAHEDVKAMLRMDGNIRYVIKEFPVLGESSVLAARAAMAAMMQGADYYEFHDAMMSHRGRLDMKTIERLAKASDVDLAQMREDMQSPEIKGKLERTYALAQQLRIEGTPTFVIGDQLVRGFKPLKDLQDVVRAEREG
ncbi:DsbA family protein [Rhodovulum sp. DZ06]|uniref:DsbA family protein n=1 Tax=Rhodovulum sp. DZ06 TaxID=3425126 RepID=UPI003D3354F1